MRLHSGGAMLQPPTAMSGGEPLFRGACAFTMDSMSMFSRLASTLIFLLPAWAAGQSAAHVWEVQELEFRSAQSYHNPYTEVTCWIELTGPGFSSRVYAFWDGGDVFRVRMVATAPGTWSWTSASNQPGDRGLNGNPARSRRGRGRKRKSNKTPTGAASCAPHQTATRCNMRTGLRSFWWAIRGWPRPRGGCR